VTHPPFEKLTAAADGELGHDAREKVYSHLVGCDTCRAEIDADRELKARLSGLTRPEPSTDLTQRLLGIPSFATEAREEVRPVVTPVTLSPAASAFPSTPAGSNRPTRPAAGPPKTRSRRRTAVVTAAGSAAAVASLLGTAFVIGEPEREQPPLLQPPVSSFSVDHATVTNTDPFGDPATLVGLSGR
jgi:anti-sigma factor RsiW